jgi:UPF0271 protein
VPGRIDLTRIDLNADLGESFGRWTLGDDEALLELVTSANIACGFHAGDPSVMRRTCEQAADRGVTIGAQVGYRDLAGFGRRFIDVAPAELGDDVLYQVAALDGFARAAGTRVRYVKPHGALYNALVSNVAQAEAVVDAAHRFDTELSVLGLPGSAFLAIAEQAGIRTFHEAFADRAYTRDGTLVPRREPGAVLDDSAEIAERCVRMAVAGEIGAVDASVLKVRPDSICVHGDSPTAVESARAARRALEAAGLAVRPFLGD